MPTSLIQLIEFDRSFISTIGTRARGRIGPAARLFVLCEMIEAYFWLVFGIELQLFPSRETELLIRHRFTEMFSGWKELFKDRGYLLASKFEEKLQTAENQSRPFVANYDRAFDSPASLHALFRYGLVLETESIRDDVFNTFCATLTVLNERDIEQIVFKESNLEGLLFLNVNPDLLADGFTGAVRHIDAFRAFDLLINQLPPSDDRFLFRSRINELTRWRLNFRVESVKRYFPIIGKQLALGLPEALRTPPIEFDNWLTGLIADWGFVEEISQSASY